MKIGVSISPEMLTAVADEARARNLTQSQVIRNMVAEKYRLPAGLTKRRAGFRHPDFKPRANNGGAA